MKTLITIILMVVLVGCASTPKLTEEEANQARYDTLVETYRPVVVALIEAEGRPEASRRLKNQIKSLTSCAYFRIAQASQSVSDTGEPDPKRIQQSHDFIFAMLAYAGASTIEYDNTLFDEVARYDFTVNEKGGVKYFNEIIGGIHGSENIEFWIKTCNTFSESGYGIYDIYHIAEEDYQ